VPDTITKSGLVGMLQALWVFRRFVLSMVERDFRARYLGSALGTLWAILTPVATIAIYLVVFSAVMRGRFPGADDPLSYGLFLCTGILVWSFFAEVVSKCQAVFVENANLLKKMSFPRITLPVIALFSAVVNFTLVAVIFLLLLIALGRFPGGAVLAFLPLLALQQAFAVGLGILLGTLHVFFRDIGQLWGVLINLWFWSTPVVYHVDILPEPVREILAWNPLTPLFLSYQAIILDGALPDWSTLARPAAATILVLILGLLTFRRLSGQMVDEL